MPTKLALLGMRCEFSRIVFETVLAAGVNVAALIIPSPDRATRWREPEPFPLLPLDVVTLAHALKVPVLEVGVLRSAEALAALEALAPEVLCAACFPKLLPGDWRQRPRLGALNLHPSLLPAYRGPEPLFWQLRNGEARTGVTLHLMDEAADTGDIVAQVEAPFPDGITYAEAERLTARAGAQLLIEVLGRDPLPRRPQPTEGVSCAPFPTAADRVLDTRWPARRAFNFVRSAEPWAPFELQVDGLRLQIVRALSCELERRLPAAFRCERDIVAVQFADGVVHFKTNGGEAG
jgi:methionyl-tRNA formyltransferase